MNGHLEKDVIEYIFIHWVKCATRDHMFVCKTWAEVIREAIKKGYYAAAVPAQQNPAALPPACFKWMTMPQKVDLPRYVRAQKNIDTLQDIHLKKQYTITWAAIINYCHSINNVDWLLSKMLSDDRRIVTRIDLFEILFIECDQFRRHVLNISLYCSFHPVYLAIIVCSAVSLRYAYPQLVTCYYETFINDGVPFHALLINNLDRIIEHSALLAATRQPTARRPHLLRMSGRKF